MQLALEKAQNSSARPLFLGDLSRHRSSRAPGPVLGTGLVVHDGGDVISSPLRRRFSRQPQDGPATRGRL